MGKTGSLQEVKIERYKMRLAANFTARRNFLPESHQDYKPRHMQSIKTVGRSNKFA